MNRIAQSIKNRLSLRPPQADSLNILAELAEKLTLKKHTPCPSQEGIKHTPDPSPPERVIRAGQEGNKMGISQEGNEHTPNPLSREEYKSPLLGGSPTPQSPPGRGEGVGNTGGDLGVGSFLQQELEKVKSAYPTCTDFERNFPSLCFALATGVGKTRLMGAFVVYLYQSKGIKNFFILAPNITIYNKLIEDFSSPNHPKYVFKGIGEFATYRPHVITGDDYHYPQKTLFGSEVRINVFNISKINAETRYQEAFRIFR